MASGQSLDELVVGIDIGGTGVKAAIVDVLAGRLRAPRVRLPTPAPATPDSVADCVTALVAEAVRVTPGRVVRAGAGFPGVVKNGVIATAAHLDDAWIGLDAARLFGRGGDFPVTVLNDADAAGIAEVRFGAGRDVSGVVVMVTLGTGIGTAVFVDGTLVPNTELGHLIVGGVDAETVAAGSVRELNDLSWGQWARHLDEYLAELERLLWPDLLIIGGGVSKKFDKFAEHLHRRTRVVPALLKNDAGIVGAALATG